MKYNISDHFQEKVSRVKELLTDIAYEAERTNSARALKAKRSMEEIESLFIKSCAATYTKGFNEGYVSRSTEDDTPDWAFAESVKEL